MFHQHRAPMAYPTTIPPAAKSPTAPAQRAPAGYHVADEPSRFSLRTMLVILASVLATGISAYRIRDTFKQDTPSPSPFQEIQKQNPEYAELIMAIRERDYDRVERAISKDPWLVNFTRPESVGSPLTMAAVTNQPDLVDLLVDRGADLQSKGRWGGTPLHWAAWRGSADATEALLKRGADVNALSDNDASTPLFWACRGSREGFWSRNNHVGVVNHLLAKGANPEIANSDGYPANAVALDEIAAILVRHGATAREPATQPTFGTSTGDTPRFGLGYGYGYRRGDESRQQQQQPQQDGSQQPPQPR